MKKNSYNKQLFAKRLKKSRENAHLTKKALSDQSGVSVVSLIDYEAGNKSPNINSVVSIADVLDVSIDWLCGRESLVNADSRNKKISPIKMNYIEAIPYEQITHSCTTKDALSTTTKMLENSFTSAFFESMDDCLMKNVPINNFIDEYCQVKKSFHKEALGSVYYNMVIDNLYRKYNQISFNDLFVKAPYKEKISIDVQK